MIRTLDAVELMKKLSERSEADQMRLSLRFMQKTGLAKWLKTKDWANFALRYNGRGYRANRYDTRLAEAYERFRIES